MLSTREPLHLIQASQRFVFAAAGLLFALGASLGAYGQGVAAPPDLKVADIVRLDSPPRVDGRLDDPQWRMATAIRDIHQIRPDEYGEPSERTEFYIYYDSNGLYVGVRAWVDQPGGITAQVLRQGGGIRFEDRVAIVIDPFLDRRNGYLFAVNPNGVRLDGLWKNTSEFLNEWDGIWEARAQRLDDGWSAELAIPFRTLSFPTHTSDWGINLWRFIGDRQEMVGWSSRNRAIDPSTAGTMRGFRDLDQGLGLDVVPSLSVARDRDLQGTARSTNFEPSLDVFYKLTPGLNASLTVNTDFSATEVDVRQVNLTRFSLFFPERRGFFLKDGDIFEFGKIGSIDPVVFQPPADLQNGRPFFSRRIGLRDTGEPVDLEYGGKLSGRLGVWNLGALAIRQAAYENVDATDIVVARVSRNVFAESTLGGILTYGDPASNADNRLLGFDYLYRNTRLGAGKTLESQLWYQQTDTDGLNGDDAAFGASLAMPNTARWRWGIGFKELQENFSPRLGFTSRTGVRNTFAALNYIHRPRSGFLRTVEGGVNYRRYDRIDGGLETEVLFVTPIKITNDFGDSATVAVFTIEEDLIEDFEISTGVVLPIGRYDYRGARLNIATGQQRKLRAQLQLRGGGFFNGDQQIYDAQVTWRPSRHYSATARYLYNDISLDQGDFTVRLASLQNEIAFSSTLAWVTLAQYDNVSDRLGIHSRLHWVPKAGRDLFLVLNHNFLDETETGRFRSVDSEFVVKFNYTWRF